jgi:hypothetical protein
MLSTLVRPVFTFYYGLDFGPPRRIPLFCGCPLYVWRNHLRYARRLLIPPHTFAKSIRTSAQSSSVTTDRQTDSGKDFAERSPRQGARTNGATIQDEEGLTLGLSVILQP